mmetsp:Transcript_13754/g.31213  ORF Transcript_13754/g.31213 Transcript_13754/m.31213 type:complete len:197 (-) Transcript_13754:44-634(-)
MADGRAVAEGDEVRVRRSVLDRLARKAHDTPRAENACAGNPLQQVVVRRSCLEKLSNSNACGQDDAETMTSHAKQSKGDALGEAALPYSGVQAAAQLARLERAHRAAYLGEDPEARDAVHVKWRELASGEQYHKNIQFLTRARRLRDEFGSILDGSDRTTDVVLASTITLRGEMRAHVAELCRAAHEVRQGLAYFP